MHMPRHMGPPGPKMGGGTRMPVTPDAIVHA